MQEAKDRLLISAVRGARQSDIADAIALGANPLIKNENDDTLLHLACRTEDPTALVKQLMVLDIDIGAINENGETLLHLLCKKPGSRNLIVQLIERGKIDINAQDKDWQTALMIAIRQGFKSCAWEMLQTGLCDLELDNFNHETPLMLALQANMHACAMFILQNGNCNINVQNEDGKTALMLAISHNMYGCAKHMLSSGLCDINIQSEDGKTALFNSIENSRHDEKLEITQIILKTGKCDLNIVDNEGKDVLMKAIERQHLELALHLLEMRDLNICFTCNQGHTPLDKLLSAFRSEQRFNYGTGIFQYDVSNAFMPIISALVHADCQLNRDQWKDNRILNILRQLYKTALAILNAPNLLYEDFAKELAPFVVREDVLSYALSKKRKREERERKRKRKRELLLTDGFADSWDYSEQKDQEWVPDNTGACDSSDLDI